VRTAKKRAGRSSRRAIVPRRPRRSLAIELSDRLEHVLILGDLLQLTPEQRIEYVRVFCKTLGLNLAARPVDYILFREDGGGEKLELYLNARGAAQLRKIHRISIIPGSLQREIHGEHCIVSLSVRDGCGTTDSATGSVSLFKIKNGQRIDFKGRDWDNAIMKCETKAKRRATLSVCGLANLDESQLDALQVLGGVTSSGRVYRYQLPPDNDPGNGCLLDDGAAHGHLPGSRQADIANAALAKVEEADRQLREERAKSASAPQQSPRTNAGTGKPPVPPRQEKAVPARPAGQSAPPRKAPPPVKEDPKLKDVWPKGEKHSTETHTDAPAEIIKGNLDNVVAGMTKQKAPMLQVRINGIWYACYRNTIFKYLTSPSAQGYVVEATVDKNKAITGLVRIGKQQFAEDGKTPVVSRDREPGAIKSMFEETL
jgi:hypothetical protein